MATEKIKDGIYSVGVQNPSLRVFDIIMKTEFGTTYNAYLVKGSEKTALIETAHNKFYDEYIENVTSLCDLKDIDYVILNHTEPDHTGSLWKIIEQNPDITVVATVAGTNNIKKITNMEFRSQIAKEGDVIDLGGKTLRFIIAPLLHWPDSMFTYIEEDAALFPCDFLGAHYCEPRLFDTHVKYPDHYDYSFLNYYTAIFGPFKTAVLNGLDKIKDLKLDVVCPSHGPVLVENIQKNMDKYREWSDVINHKNDPKLVSVFYVSAYGCTEQMAELAKEVIESKGLACNIYDVIKYDIGELKEELEKSDAIMFGSPTINRDALKPIWDVISVTDAILNKGKLTGVFGSYGWSGEAVPMLVRRLNDLKLKVLGDGVKVCFIANEKEREDMKQYTEEFVAELLK